MRSHRTTATYKIWRLASDLCGGGGTGTCENLDTAACVIFGFEIWAYFILWGAGIGVIFGFVKINVIFGGSLRTCVILGAFTTKFCSVEIMEIKLDSI